MEPHSRTGLLLPLHGFLAVAVAVAFVVVVVVGVVTTLRGEKEKGGKE